jgi:hypothetical protein
MVWHSGLSNFHVLEASCPIVGRHSHNDRLLYSSLWGQNIQLVMTILGESASSAEPMVHTTQPKVDKVDTLSVEAPMVRALAAQPRSKAPDDNPADDDLDLLNFTAVGSWITWWMSSLL